MIKMTELAFSSVDCDLTHHFAVKAVNVGILDFLLEENALLLSLGVSK